MLEGKAYLILSAPESGQLAIALDLIEGSKPYIDKAVVYYPSSIASELEHIDKKKRERAKLTPYDEWDSIPTAQADETLIVIAQERQAPPTQIEQFKACLERAPLEIGRVITIINCQLASQKPGLAEWFDCCIHFSDCVLLSKRDGVSQKWIKAFIEKYHKLCYPVQFEYVKKDYRVENPAQVLAPEARRISLIFDNVDPIDELNIDPENLPEEPFEISTPIDPYLERLENGNFAIKLPEMD